MGTPAEPTDNHLIERMGLGDEEAFVALYRRRQGAVYRFALQMSGSTTVAEDVTQEVFLTLARDPRRFDPQQGVLPAFLIGIARNLVLRRGDRGRIFVPIEGEDANAATHEGLVDRRDPLDALDRSERVARVRQAVMSLPSHYREVVVLCDLEEMSYLEAADALDCSVGTVRSRLHRARALLVEKLAERPAPEPGQAKRCFA
jgi:RNA polymerase sigma-70 factor, ECF subfamily